MINMIGDLSDRICSWDSVSWALGFDRIPLILLCTGFFIAAPVRFSSTKALVYDTVRFKQRERLCGAFFEIG